MITKFALIALSLALFFPTAVSAKEFTTITRVNPCVDSSPYLEFNVQTQTKEKIRNGVKIVTTKTDSKGGKPSLKEEIVKKYQPNGVIDFTETFIIKQKGAPTAKGVTIGRDESAISNRFPNYFGTYELYCDGKLKIKLHFDR